MRRSKKYYQARRLTAMAMAAAMAFSLAAPGAEQVYAKSGSALDIGRPEFKNAEYLNEVYDHSGSYTVGNMQETIFNQDAANGGDSYYYDRILSRPGAASGSMYSNGNEDGNTFLTRGRALYMYTSDPSVIGFGGKASYYQPMGKKDMFRITFAENGTDLKAKENTSKRVNEPSNWRGTYDLGNNVSVGVTKFITYENVAVAVVELTNKGDSDKTLDMTASSEYVSQKSALQTEGGELQELSGKVNGGSDLTTIYPHLNGEGLTYDENDARSLTGKVTIPAGKSVTRKVVMGFVTEEIPESQTDYERFTELESEEAVAAQKKEYNQWWSENIPYIDVPNKAVQKAIDYRWWLERFNQIDANIPGYDYQYPTTVEGVLGYNNAIILTQPMHLQDVKWMRSAYLPYGMLLSIGNSSQSSAFVDNPGNRACWNRHLGQYVAQAGLQAFNTIGGSKDFAETLAYYFEHDAKGQLEHFSPTDPNTEGTNLIAYANTALTGNDSDTISMHYPNAGSWKSHAENAYVFGAADSASKMYELTGNTEKAKELSDLAEAVRSDILEYLWCDLDETFETRAVSPAEGFVVHNQEKPNLIPLKETNNFNYFSMGVVPTDEASVEKYGKQLEYLKYSDEYPIFPYYTANQVDNKKQPGTNNFSNINFTLQARAYEAAIRTYDTDHKYVTPEMLAAMVEWCAWNMYPDGGDVTYPNNNEFFNFDGKDTSNYYRSWIFHNILGNYNYIFVEDMAGVQPASDDVIHLDPIDFGYDHFMVNNIRYHDRDLTIVWDDPSDKKAYYDDIPEGYSLYVDGKLAARLDKLASFDYDNGTVTVTDKEVSAKVLDSGKAVIPEALDVQLKEDRVVDMFRKSGFELGSDMENVAEGTQVTASFTPDHARDAYWNNHNEGVGKHVNEMVPNPGAVTDGVTVDMPFWGNYGSENAVDWLELDLGKEQTVDMMNIYFYNDRQGGGYAEPRKYSLQYWDGNQWKTAENQNLSPVYVQANYNNDKFEPFTASKVRIQFVNQPGHYTAVTEVQLYREGGARTEVKNQAPVVSAAVDESKNDSMKAYLTGEVKDDGLPFDQSLTYEWKVIEKPENSSVFLTDADTLNPVLTVSEEGDYKVELEVSDGELTTVKAVTAHVKKSDTTIAQDISPKATAAVSNMYAAVTDLTQLNNLKHEPSKSASGETEGWDSFNWNNNTGIDWVSYTWENPVTVNKTEIFWFEKSPWTKLPESFAIQYKDENGKWKDVNAYSDYSKALRKDRYNTVEFEPVTTSAIRIYGKYTSTADTHGIGVQRWKVYSPRIESVESVEVGTNIGTIPQLPDSVKAVIEGGRQIDLHIEWDPITEEQVSKDNEFVVNGVNVDNGCFAQATVYVRDMSGALIVKVSPVKINVKAGTTPELPKTVEVKYNNGVYDNISNKVTWGEIPQEDLNVVGEHVYTDFGQVENTELKATLVLNVVENLDSVDKSGLKKMIDQVKALSSDSYTQESWAVLEAELTKAEETYRSESSNQNQVDKAAAALEKALDQLVKKPVEKEMTLNLKFNRDEADVTKITDSGKYQFSGNMPKITADNWVEGMDSDALKFTGADSAVDLPAGKTLQSENITISYWLKRDAVLSGDNAILWMKPASGYDQNGYFNNYPVGTGYSCFFVVDGFNGFYVEEDPNTFLPENEWTHIAITFNSETNEAHIYKNGADQPLTLVGTPESITATDSSLNRLGQNGYGSNEPVGLSIDEMKIYNMDLGIEEVEKLYHEFDAQLQADKKDLKAVLDQAAEKKEADYTADSWKAFADAKAKAEGIYADEKADQAAVDAAAKALKEAMNNLVQKADKSALNALLDEVGSKDENAYTPNSWKVFADAKAAAKKVASDDKATQAEVAAAVTNLKNAVKGLEARADKDGLNALIREAQSKDAEAYTKTTWDALSKAAEAAKATAEDANADENEVKAAADALKAAMDGLKLVKPFPDVEESDWFHNEVQYVYENDIMTGLGDGTFAPYTILSRAQFVLTLYRLEGSPEVDSAPQYPDVEAEEWYADAVVWATKAGIVTGYSNTGDFGPADEITREQMAAMMYRYADYKGYDLDKKADYSKYEDGAKVTGFAADAMAWAVGNEIIKGKYEATRLDPQGETSRAEAAIILARFIKKF